MSWELFIALAILSIGVFTALSWEPSPPDWRDRIDNLYDVEK